MNRFQRLRLGRSFFEEFLDFVDLLVAEPQVSRSHHAIGLSRIAGADDGAGHGRIAQRPRDRNLTGRAAMPLADFAQPFDQTQIVRKPWRGKFEIGFALVVFG